MNSSMSQTLSATSSASAMTSASPRDPIPHRIVRVLDKHTPLWPQSVIRSPIHQDDAVLVDHSVDDELHQVLLFYQLGLVLNVLLHCFHVPRDEVLFLDLYFFLFLVREIFRQHVANPLILLVGDLCPFRFSWCRHWLRRSCFRFGYIGRNIRLLQVDVLTLCPLQRAELKL